MLQSAVQKLFKLLGGKTAPGSPAENRRTPRYYFDGMAEVTDLESGQTIAAPVLALSLCGCFVKTDRPFLIGGKVMVRIEHSGSNFSAIGRVVDWVMGEPDGGLGVEFTEINQLDRVQLESYLAELARNEKSLVTAQP